MHWDQNSKLTPMRVTSLLLLRFLTMIHKWMTLQELSSRYWKPLICEIFGQAKYRFRFMTVIYKGFAQTVGRICILLFSFLFYCYLDDCSSVDF